MFSTRTHQTTAATAPLIAAEEERLGRALTNPEVHRIHVTGQRTSRDRKTHDTLSPDERSDLWNAQLITTTGRSMDALAARLLTATTTPHPQPTRQPDPTRPAARRGPTRRGGPTRRVRARSDETTRRATRRDGPARGGNGHRRWWSTRRSPDARNGQRPGAAPT